MLFNFFLLNSFVEVPFKASKGTEIVCGIGLFWQRHHGVCLVFRKAVLSLHRGEEVVESVHACNPLLRVRLSLLQPFCLYILGGGWGGGVRCISSALDV